jgi:molybdenum cofactor cytidylyltransferase
MEALVLAAGAGQRMGGPKALLPWGDTVLALAHARALLGAGVRAVHLVARPEVCEQLASRGVGTSVHLIASQQPDALGPAGSIRAAALHVPRPSSPLVVVTPCDSLPVQPGTLARLALAHAASRREDGLVWAAVPLHLGRAGHPVLADAGLLHSYAREPSPPPLRNLLAGLGPRLVKVEVDDPTILADLDTREDVARWSAARFAGPGSPVL